MTSLTKSAKAERTRILKVFEDAAMETGRLILMSGLPGGSKRNRDKQRWMIKGFEHATLALKKAISEPCDSGSDRHGENSRSEVEGEASQSGAEGNRPPLSTEGPPMSNSDNIDNQEALAGEGVERLLVLIREIVRAAHTLCDGTEACPVKTDHYGGSDAFEVTVPNWEALSDALLALEAAIPSQEQPARAGHAVTMVMRSVKTGSMCAHGCPAAECPQRLSRGCSGATLPSNEALGDDRNGVEGDFREAVWCAVHSVTADGSAAAVTEATVRICGLVAALRTPSSPQANEADVERGALIERLRERYTADQPPPCRVCGRDLRIQRAGGGNATVWGCDGLESDPDRPGLLRTAPGYDASNDHYGRSVWTQYRGGDDDVLKLCDLSTMTTRPAGDWKRAYTQWQAAPLNLGADPEHHQIIEAAFKGGYHARDRLILRLVGDADEEKRRADSPARPAGGEEVDRG